MPSVDTDRQSAGPCPRCSNDSPRKLRRATSVHSLKSVFSHLSTSTMTASDLPGTGRVLDKFVFTRGGRALEATLARLAHVAGYGPAATALRIGKNLRGFSLRGDMSVGSALSNTAAVEPQKLRLELGLVQDIPSLRADCKRLFEYSLSDSPVTRIQALRMIVTLFIRFPYLSIYFDIPEVTEPLCYSQPNILMHSKIITVEDEVLADDLARMAYACLVASDTQQSVARLVDHLAESAKRGHELRKTFGTGPGDILPNGELIHKYCTNPATSFAALRFTSLIFRHSFLACGQDFYVKVNYGTMEFWKPLFDCITKHIQNVTKNMQRLDRCGEAAKYGISPSSSGSNLDVEQDVEGINLFSETVLEMLFRAISWDPHYKHARWSTSIQGVVSLFKSNSAHDLYPDAAFVALAKIKPQLTNSAVVAESRRDKEELKKFIKSASYTGLSSLMTSPLRDSLAYLLDPTSSERRRKSFAVDQSLPSARPRRRAERRGTR
ncbi:hypothetical protein M0805_002077 [Coniferiporia weirii]|nr:hypothetical protein M0805_002077 [Coniferiporia weirii]